MTFLLLLGVGLQTWAADAGNLSVKANGPAAGRLVPGCADDRLPASLKPADISRYCRWVVRFERAVPAALPKRHTRSEEQIAAESTLIGLTAVQPAQIEGDRASVLAQTASGNFVVVSLARRDGVWTTVDALPAPPPAKPRRQQ